MQWLRLTLVTRSFVATITSLLMLAGLTLTNSNVMAASHEQQAFHSWNSLVYVDQGVLNLQKAADTQFPCESIPILSHCYTPQQMQNAYTTTQLLDHGITGKGRTIVIIDAFKSTTITNDLATFDQAFNLPNPTFTIVTPDGEPAFDEGWAGETTLDVEWAHAIAPGAAITLVEAKSASNDDLISALRYTVQHNLGDVVSQSFGLNEACAQDVFAQIHQIYQEAAAKGITVMVSSGDQGAAVPDCTGQVPYVKEVSFPAVDPLVTAVGGTLLAASGNEGNYVGEIGLNELEPGMTQPLASGGGFSTFVKRPSYQDNISGIGAYRGVPDVAYDGGINGGVIVIESFDTSDHAPHGDAVGGTSASAPQWAAITALADQYAGKRLGFLNTALYTIAKSGEYSDAFHDITLGDNTFRVPGLAVIQGYGATNAWDPVTGLGTPKVADLIPLLATSVHQNDAAGL